MADMAEDMAEGRSCSLCCVYFVNDHGHPVLCPECWENMPKKERKTSGFTRAFLPLLEEAFADGFIGDDDTADQRDYEAEQ
jgi:hypothetical protein